MNFRLKLCVALAGIVLFVGCNTKKDKVVFTEVTTISFQLPFEPLRKNNGWVDGGRTGTGGYFFFANPETRKEIVLLNEHGNLEQTLSLKEIHSREPKISFVFAYGSDSFIAVTTYTGHALFFTKAGTVFKEIHLPNVFDSSVYENLGPSLCIHPERVICFMSLTLQKPSLRSMYQLLKSL